jgi:hypothetical protein
MFTTDGRTFLTSGDRLSGAARAVAGGDVQALASKAILRIRPRGIRPRDKWSQHRFGRRGDGAFGMSRRFSGQAA